MGLDGDLANRHMSMQALSFLGGRDSDARADHEFDPSSIVEPAVPFPAQQTTEARHYSFAAAKPPLRCC